MLDPGCLLLSDFPAELPGMDESGKESWIAVLPLLGKEGVWEEFVAYRELADGDDITLLSGEDGKGISSWKFWCSNTMRKRFPTLQPQCQAMLTLPLSVMGVDSIFSITNSMEKKRQTTMNPKTFATRLHLRKLLSEEVLAQYEDADAEAAMEDEEEETEVEMTYV